MTKQLPATLEGGKDAKHAAYMAYFATLPPERRHVHMRIALKFLVALCKDSKTPLLDAVVGEDEVFRFKALEMTAIDGEWNVVTNPDEE